MPIAFDEKLAANQSTAGIERSTTEPNGRLMLNKVILRINKSKILADAKGAIAKAIRT